MKISKELKVGLFMVSGIAILYLGFNYLKGEDFFSSNDKYYAIYQNVDGLNVSNPIMINGFSVGRVSKISLLQNDANKVLVELDISSDIVLGDSAKATLNSDFLGNKSIAIFTGDISKPLKGGDTLIAVLDRGIADILAESAQPVANNLEATIKKINQVLDQLGGTGGRIDSILIDFKSASAELKPTIVGTRRNLDSVMSSYNSLAIELKGTLSKVNPILNNFQSLTDSLKAVELNKTVKSANKALEQLTVAIEHFSTSEGTLGKLINEDSLYVNLNKAVENLDKLLIHFNNNPKHFLSPLGKSKKKIERDRRKAAKKGN